MSKAVAAAFLASLQQTRWKAKFLCYDHQVSDFNFQSVFLWSVSDLRIFIIQIQWISYHSSCHFSHLLILESLARVNNQLALWPFNFSWSPNIQSIVLLTVSPLKGRVRDWIFEKGEKGERGQKTKQKWLHSTASRVYSCTVKVYSL